MTASTNLQMGLIYGCAVEDIITGLPIICRGWKPVYFSPHKSAFLGVAPTTLDQSLIQDKRWSEGLFQILLSQVSSLWFLPFAYVFVAKNAYSILETVSCGETFKTLWNFERMWMMRSATSYLFAFIDNLIMLFGLSETTFVITAKVADEDVLKRYQHEIIEFGSSSLMFTIISTLALLNLFSSVGVIKKVIFDIEFRAAAGLIPHVILCGVTVMLHVPVYEALFVRNDKGQIPSSVMFNERKKEREREREMGSEGYAPLFETRRAKGRFLYRMFAASMFLGMCLIWAYRVIHIPTEDGRWGWIGLLLAELWFGLYWLLTQASRWNPIYRSTFKDRLSQRFIPLPALPLSHTLWCTPSGPNISCSDQLLYEKDLPAVDIFVCTADPVIEPPIMVVNTVLSVMAYDYPQEKLGVYLSDDAGSELTFYALLEASHFSKHWIPYCKKFKIEPRSPAVYFSLTSHLHDADQAKELEFIQGRIPEEVLMEQKGFSQWDSFSSRHDHDTILQILIDGRDPNAMDVEGSKLPTLVYLAREKRPKHPHNFKAGAMNALIRVSSKISNGAIILNVDCDMYSNNSHSIRDALCFFMDEEKGQEIAFVQYPQNFENITKNELYSSSLRVISEVEFHGLDGYGGPMYIGTGCFHRRDTLCGRKFSKDYRNEWKRESIKTEESAHELQESLKNLASCRYEGDTQWGNEMGLKYGCPVEDVITGLSIQCLGWKSVYLNLPRRLSLGLLPRHWSRLLCSTRDGLKVIYRFCFPSTVLHVPSLYLLHGIPLFPQVSSPWFLPFAYVILAKYSGSLAEFLWSGGTLLGWWNDQRIWLFKRTTSYLFAFMDTILRLLGFSETSFILTAKVADEDVSQRYEGEMMEFGGSSPCSPS
ncbi:Cellulose synthase-like protein E6 [Vitis vinifera]|uniref:Cellulose synthase-like protein E6 n=1 Tax=Vitis vinifera TaxID=29760 RepID=A0A438K0E5_VITVI|nr:Cellulose synthase-like protein E6 [Vitis vinifera]